MLWSVWDSPAVENRILYVGKHGSDGDTGTSLARAKLTFGAAMTAAAAMTPAPSATAPVVVQCNDVGPYLEDVTVPAWVAIMARSTVLQGTGVGNTLEVDTGCCVQFGIIEQKNGGAAAVVKLNTVGRSYIECDLIDLSGAAVGLLNISISSDGDLKAKVRTINVDTGVGVGDASSLGHMNLIIDDIYLNGNGAIGVQHFNSQTLIGFIGHIIEEGTPTTTQALYVAAGAMALSVMEIVADNAWTIDAGATLSLFVGPVTGTRVETGTALISEAGI